MPDLADTVFAVASGAGRAAIAVMRLSGSRTSGVMAALCGELPLPRRASLRRLRGVEGEVLDHALVLWMPGPESYSGEDSAELHLHGGPAVVDGVAQRLLELGARPAEPGEFTRRAFLNGRKDLVEAEAVADLIEAETAAQRRQAMRQLEGELGGLLRSWANRLRGLVAQQEALIDFPDEDIPPETEREILSQLGALREELQRHIADGEGGERLRNGLVFAVTGPPNVGKSSLVNALAGRDVAIVSALPGTTRDALETRLILGDVPVTLVDTAGLRQTNDEVEREGVRRARARAASADLVIVIEAPDGDCTSPIASPGTPVHGGPLLAVLNKVDLLRNPGPVDGRLHVSARTGQGLDGLRRRLSDHARALATAGSAPLTRARHRAALNDAVEALDAASKATWADLRAEELRQALRSIGQLTGHVYVDDLLDTIFKQFCIGK